MNKYGLLLMEKHYEEKALRLSIKHMYCSWSFNYRQSWLHFIEDAIWGKLDSIVTSAGTF